MKTIKHILVIRLSALGDVAMTVPILKTFTEQYPNVKITVLSRPFFKPLFSDIPNIHFYKADVKGKHKGFIGLYRLFIALKTLKIDAVADVHSVLRTHILKAFFAFTPITYIQIDKGRAEKKALTRSKNKIFKQLKTTHQRYADVFATLGFPIDLAQYQPKQKKELTPKIQELIGADTKKWIGIAPFAAFESKMYPLDLMEQLIDKLNRYNQYKILLFGGGATEIETLTQIAENNYNAINIAGKLTFQEELHLISNLDVMVSMDSGNAHLAAIYGIKTVTLWGVTHPFAGFYPFAQDLEHALLVDREKYPLIPTSVYGNQYPKNYKNSMRDILPNQVFKKIMEIL